MARDTENINLDASAQSDVINMVINGEPTEVVVTLDSWVRADNELSETSINAVQNKVVTTALNGKQDTLIAGDNITIEGNVISASGGGGGGGAVDSVNGKTGRVVLTATDVHALPETTRYVSSVNGLYGAVTINVPTKLTDLTNDGHFVQDASYVHTDKNYTNAEKTKLSGIETGAEVNVQSDWNVSLTSSDAYIKNKPSIPSKTSDLLNDSNYITAAQAPVQGVKGSAESTYRTGSVDITAANIGLGNVDNTSDASKPISNATQTALNAKQDKLTAGTNITIDANNVISAAGGSGGGAVDSVNGKTGVVVLNADDVGALPDTTTASDLGAYVKPSSGIPKTDLASAVQTSLDKADTALQTAPVTSVNTKTGAVVLTASDVGAYVKPSGGIPKSDLATAVQTSLGKADTALQSAPVTSVNNKTGAVSLSASDVGALPDSTTIPTKTSDLTNDSGFLTSAGAVTSFNGQHGAVTYTAPVQSVNGQTGAVTVSVPTKTSDLQNDSGYITSAPVSSVNGRTGAVTGLAEQWTVQTMTASDTAVTLQPNVFYVFPEMATLAVTVTAVGMYAFRFTSGTTATTLTVTGTTMPDSFAVESGKVYEVNVYQGYGVVSEWTA